jgi:hypothetical protein
MNQVRKRLTYANVMSSIAVFLILGGATAIAALGKKTVGTPQLKANAVTTAKIKRNAVTAKKIKKNAITTAKIKNAAVTGAKVKLSSLGTVPSAQTANVANSLANLSAFELTKTTSSANKATEAEGEAAATAVTLYEDSHFRLYGKCFIGGLELYAKVFIATKQDGAIFDSDSEELSGSPPDGYLNVGSPEPKREVIQEETPVNSADVQYEGDSEFGATAADGYTIHGDVPIAVKYGSPPAGNGPYGTGDVCLFSNYVFHN